MNPNSCDIFLYGKIILEFQTSVNPNILKFDLNIPSALKHTNLVKKFDDSSINDINDGTYFE